MKVRCDVGRGGEGRGVVGGGTCTVKYKRAANQVKWGEVYYINY